ncbi:ferredoxin [Mycobacterium sp. CBMA293]|uniref:FAD-dependent oxidoreductase n=1 Tax=unclassified Mycolicibacterium TaxID=2636767 RepID=UPI0012DF7707|nr:MULTISPECIES: FAD-dependent oxidoreductase [unclassified Mycolicibacterium]MUL49668.1 ferredoxin [Mycolicibacterium sp. CBMA 360]MUL60103.1 ferredoxin [Mycolicibacterium sp. CBMA 335]MUL72890.1 ferredoxin [Mycolicibacterium sp. CBMA 311]MUL96135.1 ferredoxin [Mycolicibacterium sp. CBMA 230]MUM08150.1 ferredoxin [Mycolicibacterium sp. CBMA 213]
MSHVITRSCCNDASCLAVCPVNCIHPTADEPDFATAEMLYIDPAACIDCGACVDECPVSAIVPDDKLDLAGNRFLDINAAYFTDHRSTGGKPVPAKRPALAAGRQLRVAVIGAGPSAFYAAEELLRQPGVTVDMFDRLPTPYGLVRAGVAPDHAFTKRIENVFAATAARETFRFVLNTEIGTHISHHELQERYHAVLYASGASTDNRLGLPQEDMAGSIAATEFVAWYNGHPDFAEHQFDLRSPTAVIIGNGNVALDVARILASDPDRLAQTDIADHALDALRASQVREVLVLGRRGVAQAAYTNAEFAALGDLPDVDVIIDPDDLTVDPATAAAHAAGTLDSTIATKIALAQEFSARSTRSARRRIVIRYLLSPTTIVGESTVTALRCTRNTFTDTGAVTATGSRLSIQTGLLLRAVGYRGQPIAGLPFDDQRAIVPNSHGRVLIDGKPAHGVYVTGWIKRGPTGGIGMNRVCGRETATAILSDFAAGLLNEPTLSCDDTPALAAARGATVIAGTGWSRIDAREKALGRAQGRRRVKLVHRADLERAARP